jgi:putative transposase
MNHAFRDKGIPNHTSAKVVLKRERIRRRTYKTREEARQDVFDYIEMFYNPMRKQVRNGMLSPVEFERQQILKAEGV